jgi:hypothetical protein
MAILTANAAGEVSGKFTIPANVPAGAKGVAVLGAGGSYGVTTFTGRGTIRTEERRIVTTITENRVAFFDPLAQTFTLNESRHIAAVDLWFTVAGVDDVIVQLRDTDNGFPGRSVIAEKRVKPSSIITNGNHTRVTFDAPVWLDGGREFALVLLTDGADAAVAVAELGKFDASAQKWITSQAYQVGVLLSSSNAATWTAHQEKDLAFRLQAAKFTETSKTVSLGTVSLSDTSDLLAMLNVEVPATGANAEIIATAPDGTSYRMVPGRAVNLPTRINGNMSVSMQLTGTEKASPVVYPGMQFAAGDLQTSAIYVSRGFPCGTNARVSISFEALTTGSAEIAVALKKTDGSWQTVALTSGVEVGDGWVERKYVVTGFSATTTAVRLTLTGNAQNRPRVRKLRAVATD